MKIYSSYKKLRNQIRKLDRDESLRVIWDYLTTLQENLTLQGYENDQYKNIPRNFLLANWTDRTEWLSQWELARLAEEIILHGRTVGRPPKSLKDFEHLQKVLAKYETVKGSVNDEILIDSNRETHDKFIWQEIHTQLPWKKNIPNKPYITAYYMIYSNPCVNQFIKELFDADVKSVMQHGAFIWRIFRSYFRVRVDSLREFEFTGWNLDIGLLNTLLNNWSVPISELKNEIDSANEMDENLFFRFSPLRRYPLIRVKEDGVEYFISPVPTYIYFAASQGLYYQVVDSDVNEKLSDNFGEQFGYAFEAYVGEIINEGSNDDWNMTSDEQYGKPEKDSSDWIVEDKNGLVLHEVKTTRPRLQAKTELSAREEFKEDFERIAEAVAQLYWNLRELKENELYPIDADQDRPIYLLLVTLEDWFLSREELLELYSGMVEEKVKEKNCPPEWITKYPFEIIDVGTYQSLIREWAEYGIDSVYKDKYSNEEDERRTFKDYFYYKYRQDGEAKYQAMFEDTADELLKYVSIEAKNLQFQ